MTQREFQVKNLTTEYLDGMMPGSKVTYNDLVSWLYQKTGYASPHVLRDWAREVVQNRLDFFVQRGKGICKVP